MSSSASERHPPPTLPDRYQLRIRLGRDGDVHEWLATDSVLDRAVLVRVLDPDSAEVRQRSFLSAVRGAASVTHTHLAAVFAAGLLERGAYLVAEWAGGVTLADRMEAGETLPSAEFLPNAAGLADALASLHENGVVHGSIDPRAITYTQAHPAKLGAFGRAPRYRDPVGDVRALAEVLEQAATGGPAGVALPSQVLDGLPEAVDHTLEAGRRGELSAADLAARLRAIPSVPSRARSLETAWSWRWLVPASVLLALAVGIASLGLILRSPQEADSFLYPADPGTSSSASPTPAVTAPTTAPATEGVRLRTVSAYDPFGDGREHDDDASNVADGDPETTWRTERYFDPLPLLKQGVGLAIEVEGTPGSIEFVATPGTIFGILWAETMPDAFDEWTRVASGTAGSGPARFQVPPRDGGIWLLWFESLPDRGDGYYTEVAEVRVIP